MAQFINVWPAEYTPGPFFYHQCVACEEVVQGLAGMQNHKCQKEEESSAKAWCDLETKADSGDHERPDPDLQV